MLGADAIGLNFYKQSPRYVDTGGGGNHSRDLPPFVDPVGAVRQPPLQGVLRVVEPARGRMRHVSMAREHRELTGLFSVSIDRRVSGQGACRIFSEITRYLDACRGQGKLPAAILIDARVPGSTAAPDRTAPWQLLADFQSGRSASSWRAV